MINIIYLMMNNMLLIGVIVFKILIWVNIKIYNDLLKKIILVNIN